MLTKEKQDQILKIINIVLAIFGFLSFISLIMITGFYISDSVINFLTLFIKIQIAFFILQEIYRFIVTHNKKDFIKRRYIELLIAVFFLLFLVFPDQISDLFKSIFQSLKPNDLDIIYLITAQVPFLIVIFRKLLKYAVNLGRIQLHSGAIFMISFAIIILFGTFLLMLPKSVPLGSPSINFVNALFTSTSAVCVTGLAVLNVATDFSFTGQLFILSLIQIGGLGVLTLTALFAMFANGGISFQIRVIMSDVLSDDNLSDITQLIKRIILYTFVSELICAIPMYISLGGSFSQPNGDHIYTAIFHSISAFCNAGFSTYSNNLMDPAVQNNYLFLSMIMILITIGGIGFPVIQNLLHLKPFAPNQKRLRYQLTITTKVVLITSFCLVVIPTILLFFVEPMTYFPDSSEFGNFFHSLFLSVTSRTAGFNTLPLNDLRAPSVILVICIMSIGASPASTGGGIKTTTFAIVILQFFRLLKGQEKLFIFNREIHREVVRKALLIMFAYFLCFAVATFVISSIEPEYNIVDISFDVISALSTVGLYRDFTPYFSVPTKFIIILCMFIGRIGVLTFFMAFHRPKLEPNYKLPKTHIMIG